MLGCTISPGHGSEKHLYLFIFCCASTIWQLRAVLAIGDRAQQDIKNFITSHFPRFDPWELSQGFGMMFSLEERRNISRVNFWRWWAITLFGLWLRGSISFGPAWQCRGEMLQLPVLPPSPGVTVRDTAPALLLQVTGDHRSPSTIQRHLWLSAAHFSSCFPLLIPLGQ